MADLSVTATSVVKGSGTVGTDTALAGVAITAGQTVYKDSSSLWQLADANLSSTASSTIGIALNNAGAGQPVQVATTGNVTMGSILTSGVIYVQSATAGGIAPSADINTGWYVTILGVATSSSNLLMQPWITGAVK